MWRTAGPTCEPRLRLARLLSPDLDEVAGAQIRARRVTFKRFEFDGLVWWCSGQVLPRCGRRCTMLVVACPSAGLRDVLLLLSPRLYEGASECDPPPAA